MQEEKRVNRTTGQLNRLRLGDNIRKIRKSSNRSLQQLADQIGVTKGLLSQIERGRTNPSMNTLWSLADALAVHVTRLLKSPSRRDLEIRSADTRVVAKGTKCYFLLPADNTDFEFCYVEYMPGAKSGDEPSQHYGIEYFLVVEGRIEATIGNRTLLLKRDDSIRFSGELPHSMKNVGRKKARTLFAVSPDEQ